MRKFVDRSRHTLPRNLLLVGGLAASLSAQADVIFQVEDFTNTGVPASLASTAFEPFDTSLGTLDRVRFDVTGFLQVAGVASPNLVGPTGIPAPYAYSITVEQSLYGLASFNGFRFGSPAQFLYPGVASGGGGAVFHHTTFSYSLTFDALTDLVGFDIPSGTVATVPPIWVTGLREDFHEDLITAATGLMVDNVVTTQVISPLPLNPSLTMSNLVTLTYEYTPYPEQPPVGVPEPATLMLCAMGLLAAARDTRKRSKLKRTIRDRPRF